MLKLKNKPGQILFTRGKLNVELAISGFSVRADVVTAAKYCTESQHHAMKLLSCCGYACETFGEQATKYTIREKYISLYELQKMVKKVFDSTLGAVLGLGGNVWK